MTPAPPIPPTSEPERPDGGDGPAAHLAAAAAAASSRTPRANRANRAAACCERAGQQLAAALAGAAVVAAAAPGGARHQAALLTFVTLVSASVVCADLRWARLLPCMSAVPLSASALLALVLLGGAHAGTGSPDVGAGFLLLAVVVQAPTAAACRALAGRRYGGAVRVAVIGDAASAAMLQRELRLAGLTRYELVGKIDSEAGAQPAPGAPIARLGSLADIGTLVSEFEIDLLLMTAECARMPVFEAIGSCLHLRVRLTELSTFYEETFGHVPAAEINAAWFQYLVHPSYHQPSAAAKRALDVLGAVIVGIPFLVALAVLAPLIRRDGGPLLFWQERVGEGGRKLRMCKLRTMSVGSAATWACPDDPRVTRIGRMLRRTHIDELPQLLHVLRGEMSLVGPRPEQRHLVEQLERESPFYSSRHLVRPGIAGWAQLRCGYAGSDVGSAWKLCHDLYYLKHRSLAFDLAILGETARTLFADTQRVPDPTGAWFIVGHDGAATKVQPIAVAQQLPAG